jgi:hypothetical protein
MRAIEGNTTLFTENQYQIYGQIKPFLGLYFATNFRFGDSIDYSNNRLGTMTQVTPTINWNVNQHIEIKLKQTFRKLDADGENVFIARLTDLRTTYQFNVMSFLRLTVIYNNTHRNPANYLYIAPEDIEAKSKNFATELLYAYKINPQTVFYLGYADHYFTDEDLSDLAQDQRNIFLKFSYAWLG